MSLIAVVGANWNSHHLNLTQCHHTVRHAVGDLHIATHDWSGVALQIFCGSIPKYSVVVAAQGGTGGWVAGGIFGVDMDVEIAKSFS